MDDTTTAKREYEYITGDTLCDRRVCRNFDIHVTDDLVQLVQSTLTFMGSGPLESDPSTRSQINMTREEALEVCNKVARMLGYDLVAREEGR